MPSSSSRLPLRALAAAALLAACREPLAVASLSGRTYALAGRGASAAPVITSASLGDTVAVVADTLTFEGGGRVRQKRVWRAYGRSGTSTTTSNTTMEFRLSGSQVLIGFFTPCPATALCVPNLSGTVSDGSLEIAEEFTPRPPAWRYARVGAAR